MSINTPTSAPDSSERINPESQLNGPPEHTNSDVLERVQTESRIIVNLVFKKSQNALDAVIREYGGSSVIWEGLDQSGYENFGELCADLMNSVTGLHAKLVARENRVSGNVAISQEELEGTLRTILVEAFANHGVLLQSVLNKLKEHKTV